MSGRFVSNQEFLKKLVEKTESNLTNDQFGVTELARQMGMSRSNLHLRVKKLTKLSVSQFINQIRLKKAMELLKPGTSTIAQIAFDCGFRSVSYFTKCFREYYGFTPGEVGKYAGTEKIGKKKRKITIIINNRWILISLLMLGIIVPVAIISYNSLVEIAFTSRTDDLENTIAVLPFKNLNNDKDYDYLSAGIVETINRYLFQVSDLKVISVTSAEQFMDSDKSAKDIRQELKVTHLLEGSIQRDKNMMRIEVKLIDTDTESQVWAEYYDIELRNILKTQSDIAEKVVIALKKKLSSEDKTVLTQRMTENVEAYDLYLKGIYENRTYTRTGNQRALDFFQQAIYIDSNYALPYTGMAVGTLAKASIFGAEISAKEALMQAKFYIDKAIALEPELPEARIWNGFYMLYNNWDFTGSEQEYKKAILINNPDALAVYADLLNFTRRHSEALEISNRLNQKYPYYPNSRMVLSLYYLGRYKEAEEFVHSRMRLFNNFYTLNNYGFLKLNTGKYQEAISIFQQIFELEEVRYPRILGWLGAAYARSGQQEKAIQLIEELEDISAHSNAGSPNFFLAVIFVALGDEKKAIKSLHEAVESHEMEIPWLISEPQLYSLHSNPAFNELTEIVGFPK